MIDTEKRPRLRIAEAVESGVEGLILFLVRYFRTGAVIIFSPRRAIRHLLKDRHATVPLHVLPLTYLAIGLFLLSLLGQVAGTSVGDWIWFGSNIAEKVGETFSKELSMVQVAIEALPGIAVVGCFVAILRFQLRVHGPRSRRLVNFTLSYAFGAQAWCLFMLVCVAVILYTLTADWDLARTHALEMDGWLEDLLSWSIILLVLAWILAAVLCPLVFVLSALGIRRLWRSKRVAGIGLVASIVIAMSLGHVGVLHATRLPADIVKRAKGPDDPTIAVNEARYSMRADGIGLMLHVTVTNPGTKYMAFETRKFALRAYPVPDGQPGECQGDSVQFTVVRLADAGGAARPFATVEPGHTEWFAIELAAPNDERTRKKLTNTSAWGLTGQIRLVEGEAQLKCQVRDVGRSGPS